MKINMTLKVLLVALMITSATQTQAMNFNWRKWTLIGAGIAGIALVTRYVINSRRAAERHRAAEEERQAAERTVRERRVAEQAEIERRAAEYQAREDLRIEKCRPLLDAIENAVANNDLKAVRQLIADGVDLNLQGMHYNTALMRAAQEGRIEIVKELIAANVNLNLQNLWLETALMQAVRHGHTAIVQALINAGANFNLQGIGEWTALKLAVHNGNTAIVQMLIDAGADIHLQDRDGDTVLLDAAKEGLTEVVQVLICAETNLNLQDKSGWTALRWAAQDGNTNMAQVLIDAGADINLPARNGRTALTTARRCNKLEIVRIMDEELARNSTPLHQACAQGLGSRIIELFLRDEDKLRAVHALYDGKINTFINNNPAIAYDLPHGTITLLIEELCLAENADLQARNANGFSAHDYLCMRAWLMSPIDVEVRTLTGHLIIIRCTRGTKIYKLKTMISRQLPEHPGIDRMELLHSAGAQALDNDVIGMTKEYHLVVSAGAAADGGGPA